MSHHSDILADLAEIRSQLKCRHGAVSALLKLSPARPLIDIGFDWLIVFGAVAAVFWLTPWLAPLAIGVIANRQRALGNILHDAGHRNLWRHRPLNDLIAHTCVAPLLFASLTSYRETHFKHHMALGRDGADPDLLPVPGNPPGHWLASFVRHLLSWRTWVGSVGGHLLIGLARPASRLYIVAWWGCGLFALAAMAGTGFAITFMALWLLSRATVFHLITTFREMCDHYGLRPGGVFSFSRDMACGGFWRAFIHPRNNGYHLTHHLLPAVPYYRLPAAHALFRQMPAFQAKGTVCTAYFRGEFAVTNAWRAAGPQ